MTSFVNLRTQCASRFRDAANAVVTDAQWKDYVNQAYQHANAQSPFWPWNETSEQTVTVLSGTRGIALPSDILTVNWVYDSTDQYVLIPQEGRGDPWRHGGLRTDTGVPVTYRVRGGNLEVFPLPTQNTVLILEGNLMPVRLVGDTDVPAWPANFHENLIPGALALAFLDDGNVEFHDKNWAKFEADVKAMLNAVLYARTDSYSPIRDTFWS